MGDFSRSFFRGDAREVRKEEERKKREEGEKDPLLRRARVILPKGIAPTKEHDLAGEVSGSSLKPGRAFSVTRAIDRGPLFDCRIGKEYTPRRQTRLN